jgi:hypothetical protein
MAQFRLNLDEISATIRRCEHIKNKCNECSPDRLGCKTIATFSIANHGVDGARKLAEEKLKEINPKGKTANGEKTFTRFLGKCSGEGCRRYISEGDQHYVDRKKLFCFFCGSTIDTATQVAGI